MNPSLVTSLSAVRAMDNAHLPGERSPAAVTRSHRVLVFAPVGGACERLVCDIEQAAGVEHTPGPIGPRLVVEGTTLDLCSADTAAAAVERLQSCYLNLVLVDLRCEDRDASDYPRREAAVLDLLAALDRSDDVEARFGFHRILVLLSGPDPDRVDRTISRLGMQGVGHVLRQRELDDSAFALRVIREALTLVDAREAGKRALCAAGGGVTGIYFELGALKVLQDCLSGDAINQFDMYFGISAGAVVTSFLANGYSVDEVMAAMAGIPGGRIEPLDLRILRLGHLDFPDLGRRARLALRTALRGLVDLATLRSAPSLESLLFEYGEILGPPFSSAGFGRMLEKALTADGACNDFRALPRSLFIGATDQDTREHVLFGAEGHDRVSISRAIQGSLSFNPAFTSTPIDGAFYEDGAVTRTSNFEEAIRRGARLIIVLDPFVPYVSRQPGAAARRGLLYNIDQNIRTISYTRFELARSWILRKHPEVSAYTFLPSNTQRRLMTVNPMDYRPYLAIWKSGYLATLSRIQTVQHRLEGDVAAHGIRLDLARAEAVAARLSRTEQPTFADFFPDGRIDIRKPPLCRQP